MTCLVNERVALAPVRRTFADRRVIFTKGDWTRQERKISALLLGQARDGLPLYLFYPSDGGAPTVLALVLSR